MLYEIETLNLYEYLRHHIKMILFMKQDIYSGENKNIDIYFSSRQINKSNDILLGTMQH